MPRDFLRNADLLSLPAAIPQLEVMCRAAPCMLMGAQGALQSAEEDYHDILASNGAELSAFGSQQGRRAWHSQSRRAVAEAFWARSEVPTVVCPRIFIRGDVAFDASADVGPSLRGAACSARLRGVGCGRWQGGVGG